MRRNLARYLPVVFLTLLTLAGCSSEETATDQEVLASLMDGVVVLAYESLHRDMEQLDRDVQALCDAPGEASLQAARDSWREARASWSMSRAMWFGPVMDRRSVRLLDWSPTKVDGVVKILDDGRVLSTGDALELLASNLRGFGAIEYLLFSGGPPAAYAESQALCPYLTALVEVAGNETAAVLKEWLEGTEGRSPYRDYFSDRAAVSILPDDAVAEVVRTQVFLIREMVDMRLASALGLRGDGPDLTLIPGTSADNGLLDLRNEILGMQAIYEGRGEQGLGISDLVRPLSEDTDQRLRDQFTTAISAIDAAEGPLRAAIAERPDQIRAVYESLQGVQITISTEVVSLLGVSVGFTDTDGDSQR